MKILLIVNIRKSFLIYSTFSLELWQGKSSYNDFVSQRQNKYFTFSSSSLTYESKKWPREIGIRYPILLNFYASGYPRYLITKIFILPVYAADQLIPWLTIFRDVLCSPEPCHTQSWSKVQEICFSFAFADDPLIYFGKTETLSEFTAYN